jgi:AbiV family abortive infection protein
MKADQLTPEECLVGARLCLSNARRLYVASRHLRRLGFGPEAVLLLATAVEELAKSGLLHRAGMIGEDPHLFEVAVAGFGKMLGGRGAHRRKHAAAAFSGSTTFAVAIVMALITDFLAKDQSGAKTTTMMEALLGSPPEPPPGWFDRLWQQRQTIYVGWEHGRWVHGDPAGIAFYDEGRTHVLRLFHNLRADLRQGRRVGIPIDESAGRTEA